MGNLLLLVQHKGHVTASDRIVILARTGATRQLTTCAVNTNVCIMLDNAGADVSAPFPICHVFIYTSFPSVLKCCSGLLLDDWAQGGVFIL